MRIIFVTKTIAILYLLVSLALPSGMAKAQETSVIFAITHWRGAGELPKPDMSKITKLRFVTSNDYPPFNYIDEAGELSGFNIDLARALCDELSLICTIEPLAWDKQVSALNRGLADAVIASRTITRASRRKVSFTQRYYRTPARFVTRKNSLLKSLTPKALAGKRIAVRKGTAHEAYLWTFFSKAKIRSYSNDSNAREALAGGRADILFGDAIGLMFWLKGSASKKCCHFAGGFYTEPKFFGNGVGIALKKNNRKLALVLNYGLERLRIRGVYQDLVKRYFPAETF